MATADLEDDGERICQSSCMKVLGAGLICLSEETTSGQAALIRRTTCLGLLALRFILEFNGDALRILTQQLQ